METFARWRSLWRRNGPGPVSEVKWSTGPFHGRGSRKWPVMRFASQGDMDDDEPRNGSRINIGALRLEFYRTGA